MAAAVVRMEQKAGSKHRNGAATGDELGGSYAAS